MITMCVSRSITTVHITGFSGDCEKSVKYCCMYCGSPLRLPVSDATMYWRHHPDTTA